MTGSWSLAAALVLGAVYAVGGLFVRSGEGGRNRTWISAGAGVSVAYVFVDVLPDLAVRHEAFVKASGEGLLFAEQRIYLAALLGFVIFYGLEHMVLTSRTRGRLHAGDGAGDVVYWLEVAGFAAYSWVIGYLLVERAMAGGLALALYTLAMAFHFHLVDHSMREEHGRAYERVGRWILAASVPTGWAVGTSPHMPEALLSRLFALVVGGVVITSMKAELPREGEGRFWPFVLGATGYALLLLAV
jgi:hypothetical protein